MKVRNWREKCKDKRTVERNRKAGQNPPRVIAPIEEGGGGGSLKLLGNATFLGVSE